MNDRLKDYIDNNREAFDAFEAPAGSWDAINGRLHGKQQKRTKVIKLSAIASAAAIIGLFLYVAILQPNATNELMAEDNNLTETELFYATQVNQKRAQVYQMSGSYPELQVEMDNDLAELDTIMLELKRDLNENVDNAEVVEAMIQNYRMKLSILEDIMLFLEEQEKSKNQKHTSYDL